MLVNNAGIFQMGDLEKITLEDFDEGVNIHVKAVLSLTQLLKEALAQSKLKAIVNVSSYASKIVSDKMISYYTTKSALDQLTRCMSVDLIKSCGIRVNSVNPASIATFFVPGRSEQEWEEIGKTYPVGRIGQPEDVSHAILFLASDQAAHIVGQTLVLCGGKSVESPYR